MFVWDSRFVFPFIKINLNGREGNDEKIFQILTSKNEEEKTS